MKKFKFNYILLAIIVTTICQYSCKKSLDLTPLDKINDAIFYILCWLPMASTLMSEHLAM
jgi:hypothetical protein